MFHLFVCLFLNLVSCTQKSEVNFVGVGALLPCTTHDWIHVIQLGSKSLYLRGNLTSFWLAFICVHSLLLSLLLFIVSHRMIKHEEPGTLILNVYSAELKYFSFLYELTLFGILLEQFKVCDLRNNMRTSQQRLNMCHTKKRHTAPELHKVKCTKELQTETTGSSSGTSGSPHSKEKKRGGVFAQLDKSGLWPNQNVPPLS